MWDSIRSVPELERLWQPYPLRIRLSVADRASANSRADIGLNEPEFLPNHIKCTLACDVHRVATSIKYAAGNAEADVSGVLNVGLVCSELGCVRALRGILIHIFESSLQIEFGFPPQGRCAQYRAEVFDLYLPIYQVPKSLAMMNKKRRWILQKLCNGDLEERTITHHCQWGCCTSEEDTRRAFAFFASWALVPCACPIYSRKSWTGCEKALSWTGLLASHHSLLERVMAVYIGAPEETIHQANVAPDWGLLALQDAEDERGAKTAETSDLQQLPPGASQPSGTSPTDWTAFKRQKRKLVTAWLRSNPTPRLAVIKSSLDPVLKFLADMLIVGGSGWERKQQHLASKGQTRSYIVVEAAEGSRLAGCMLALQQLLHADLAGVSFADITGQLRCLRFKMLSCCMTSLHALVRMSHRGMPYQLFQLLSSSIRHMADRMEVASLLHGWPVCMCEPLSKKLLEDYNSQDLLVTDEFLAILESLASAMGLDIAGLECKHAKNREHTLLRNRGWVPSLETVSSKFMCRFSNAGLCSRGQETGQAGERQSKQKKGKKKGGGAWRAFLSHKFSGKSSLRKVDMAEMSREYHNLSDAELLHYKLAGEAGTLAARAGFAAFGKRQREKQSAMPVAPGCPTDSGALVALGSENRLVDFAGISFAEQYHTFKQDLQSARGSQHHDVTLSQQEVADLSIYSWPSPPQVPIRSLQQDAPSMSPFFEKRGTQAPGLKASRWHPPLATAVQAGLGLET